MEYKICNKCKESKPATTEFFHKNKQRKDGLKYRCKICCSKRPKGYKPKYQIEIESGKKTCRNCGIEKPMTSDYYHVCGNLKKEPSGFRGVCIECRSIKEKKYNTELILEGLLRCSCCKKIKKAERQNFTVDNNRPTGFSLYCRDCQSKNDSSKPLPTKDNHKVCGRCYEEKPNTGEYFHKHKKTGLRSICKTCSNDYAKERLKDDPLFHLRVNTRRRIQMYFKKNGKMYIKYSENFLGCNFEEFKKYLETKFAVGMSWDNYGKGGWHLDHYYPISLAKNEEDMYIFNHYSNFQPLWEIDNLKKSNRIPEGFNEWYDKMKKII